MLVVGVSRRAPQNAPRARTPMTRHHPTFGAKHLYEIFGEYINI